MIQSSTQQVETPSSQDGHSLVAPKINGLIPQEQYDRVFGQSICDIDYEFLGFTGIYEALAEIVPHHWTVVDLGCAYAPQAWLFKDHKLYVGVDLPNVGSPGRGRTERFSAPNTRIYEMPIADFISLHGDEFDQETTFAICSYVPPWGGDNMKIARTSFKNVFTYYPAKTPFPLFKRGGTLA